MRRFSRQFGFALFIFLNLNLILNLFLFVSPSFAQYFTINKYHSDITVHEDSSLLIKERIEVKFDRPRHGIYREIPFKYRDEFGKMIETPTKVLSVVDEGGKTRKYRVEKTGSVINIRIGDADRYVDGNQVYAITYKVENVILFLKDHDELYWNVTGNAWKAPIREASAEVMLAVKGKSKELWAACYTGRYGSRGSECDHETFDNRGRFITKKNLSEGEGLTIAFGWDKGVVSPPPSWKKFLWRLNLGENWVFLLPFLSLAYMITRWYRKGRDPRVRESVRVMYEPPKYNNQPLNPAEIGTLVDEKLDSRDITATIIGLAVRGYIKIEETKKEGWIRDTTDYTLRKAKEADSNLSLFETELMKSLFAGSLPGTPVLVSGMKNKFYTNLDLLKKTLYGELVKKRYFLRDPEKVRGSYIGAGIVVIVFGGLLLAFLNPDSIARDVFASVLMALPLFAFAKVMPAKTREGASAYMDILGFREFLNRAEKDRLERMGDKDLFSKFLPYAIALDVAENWAKAFEGIYQEAPDWYSSPAGMRTFTPYGFSHSIQSVTSNLSSAVFSAPRGSGIGGGGGGGGGGGSSGGGSGGGGGGSW